LSKPNLKKTKTITNEVFIFVYQSND